MGDTLHADADLEGRIRDAIDDEQLQFWTRHPAPDHGWETTRAVAPEIVAFHNKEVSPPVERLAIEYYEAGETDADDYTWENDTYVLDITDRQPVDDRAYTADGAFDDFMGGNRAVFHDKDAMLNAVAHIMATVVEERD